MIVCNQIEYSLSITKLPASLLPSMTERSIVSSENAKIGFVPLNLPAAICPIRARTIVTPFTLNVDFLYTYYIM